MELTDRLTVLSGGYRFSGGELEANTIDVGVNRHYLGGGDPIRAAFVQTGGTVRSRSLSLSTTYFYLQLDHATHADGGLTDAAAPGIIPLLPREINARYRLAGGELIADTIYLSQSYTGNGGSTRFVQTGGSVISDRRISMNGPQAAYVMDGGSLTARELQIGAQYVLNDPGYIAHDSATLAIRNAASGIEIRGELLLGGGSHFHAVPGTTIRMTNPEPDPGPWRPAIESSRFRTLSFNAADVRGLNNLTLVFDGQTSVASIFEVAGLDLGSEGIGDAGNFAFDALYVGGQNPAAVRLEDLIDNQRNGMGNEALYVDTLVVTPGSMLDLGGLNLYYRRAQIDGDILHSGGSLLAAVPEPVAGVLLLFAFLGLVGLRRSNA